MRFTASFAATCLFFAVQGSAAPARTLASVPGPHELVLNATVALAERLGEATHSRYYGTMMPGTTEKSGELLREWMDELLVTAVSGNYTLAPNAYPAAKDAEASLIPRAYAYITETPYLLQHNATVLRNPSFCKYVGSLWQSCGYLQNARATEGAVRFMADCLFGGIDPSLAAMEASVLNAGGAVACPDMRAHIIGHNSRVLAATTTPLRKSLARVSTKLKRLLMPMISVMGITWLIEQTWLFLEQAKYVEAGSSTASDINLIGGILATLALIITILSP